jgi:hypothetical protein
VRPSEPASKHAAAVDGALERVEALSKDLEALSKDYEGRIAALEDRIVAGRADTDRLKHLVAEKLKKAENEK